MGEGGNGGGESMSEKLEWKKFLKEHMPKFEWFWVSDYKSIWLRHAGGSWCQEMDELVWSKAQIIFPELPKKERHECISEEWICKEIDSGKLTYYLSSDENMTFSYVKYCPFCGYKPEEK